MNPRKGDLLATKRLAKLIIDHVLSRRVVSGDKIC
jgi:hypothetical protein